MKQFSKENMVQGTECDVYLDGDRAFRESGFDEVYYKSARELIGHQHPHVVQIFDVWKQDNLLIIEMERLSELGDLDDEEHEVDMVYEHSQDNLDQLAEIIPEIKNPKLAEVFRIQLKAARSLGRTYFDIGPHNCMVDNNGTLKIIDLW